MHAPETVHYRTLSPDDLGLLRGLIRLYAEEFEMPPFRQPDDAHLGSLLRSATTFFLVAVHEGAVVGGLTAHLLPSVYSTAGEVYLYDLAVAAPFQRRGIGTRLITELRSVCTSIGAAEMFVQADIADDHAVAFYRATNGAEEQVLHFSYPT
ncbi:MAG: GNAT family N-acetyltransferase [Bacteroidetes bacterium]|nr:GNAT family N-acetyltransferase [Bacteroidota bacterium]